MDYFRRNIEALSARFPALSQRYASQGGEPVCGTVITSRDGRVTLRVPCGGSSSLLHSAYNPGEEADAFIRGQDIDGERQALVIGFGLGYHVESLLDHPRAPERICVFEARSDVFRAALHCVDLARIFTDPRVAISVEEDGGTLMRSLHAAMTDPSLKGRHALVVHRPSLALYRGHCPGFVDIVEKIYVAPRMQKLLRDNFVANLHETIRARGVRELFGAWKGRPVFLVSAGPSLNGSLAALKQAQGRGPVVCVSTIFSLLMRNGIRPDIVAVGDPKPVMITHFEGLLDSGVPLLFLPTACPEVVSRYRGPKIVAMQNEFRLCDLTEQRLKKGRVDVGESVSTLILDVALKSGADPVVLVGQDLAFVDGFTHADGVGKRLKMTRVPREVESVTGSRLAASSAHEWIRHWIEKRIERTGNTVVNVSPSGARIHGTVEMGIMEAVTALTGSAAESFSPVVSRVPA